MSSLSEEAKRIDFDRDQCLSVMDMYKNEPLLDQTMQAIWGILMANGVKVELGTKHLTKNSYLDEEANCLLQGFSKDVMVYMVLFGVIPFWIIDKKKNRRACVPPLGSGYMRIQLDPTTHMPSYLWFWSDNTSKVGGNLKPFTKMKFYEVNRPTSTGELTSAVSKVISKYNFIKSCNKLFMENEQKKVLNVPIIQETPPPYSDTGFQRFLDYQKINDRDAETRRLLNQQTDPDQAYMTRYSRVYGTPRTSLTLLPNQDFATKSLESELFDREETANALSTASSSLSMVYGDRWGQLVKPIFKPYHNLDTGYIEKLNEQLRGDLSRTLGFPIPSNSGSGTRALSEGVSLERNYIASRIGEYKLHFEKILTAAYLLIKKPELKFMDEIVKTEFDQKMSLILQTKVSLQPTVIISDSVSRDISTMYADDPATHFEFTKAVTNFDMEERLKRAGKEVPTAESMAKKRQLAKESSGAPKKKKQKTK
jgi:hypothetical protein